MYIQCVAIEFVAFDAFHEVIEHFGLRADRGRHLFLELNHVLQSVLHPSSITNREPTIQPLHVFPLPKT